MQSNIAESISKEKRHLACSFMLKAFLKSCFVLLLKVMQKYTFATLDRISEKCLLNYPEILYFYYIKHTKIKATFVSTTDPRVFFFFFFFFFFSNSLAKIQKDCMDFVYLQFEISANVQLTPKQRYLPTRHLFKRCNILSILATLPI